MENAGLDDLQTGLKIAGRNTIAHRYAVDINLMAESKEEPKSPWWMWKRSEKMA